MPEAWFKFINKADSGVVSVGRQEARIHFPLKNLRDICLRKLQLLVRSQDDISELEIPKSLKAEMLHLVAQSTQLNSRR